MVFKHNQKLSNDDHYDLLAYGSLRGLETHNHCLNEIPLPKNAIQRRQIADFEKENMFSNSERELRPGGAVQKDNHAIPFEDSFNLSWLNGSSSEAGKLDYGKRSLSDANPFQDACKRQKQMEQSTLFLPFEENPFMAAFDTLSDPALADEFVGKRQLDRSLEHTANTTCCITSGSPCSTCKEPIKEESSPLWRSSFPSCYEDYQQVDGFDNGVDEIDSPVHEFLPRKSVAVGPDHQADIPDWRPRAFESELPLNSQRSSSLGEPFLDDEEDDDGDSEKWIIATIMPMPEPDSDSAPRTLQSKIECDCNDKSSIRCVRQHVMEAREGLQRKLGQGKFDALGLFEMGEDVALNWTEEEEQLFRVVVFSNPVSLGRNFWNVLSHAFPDRSTSEMVCYYFNVFMLRKRGLQNRLDPMNVDSDDDEMPETNRDDLAGGTEQEEEDSGIESPAEIDCFDQRDSVEDVHEGSEEEDDLDDFSLVRDGREVQSKYSYHPYTSPLEENLGDFGEDPDIQDESCTSFELQHNGADSHDQASMMQNDIQVNDDDLHRVHGANSLSGIAENGLFDDHCDPKTWDVGFTQGKGVDFLSTGNVIEEVIGMGAWETNEMDGSGH